MADLLDYLVIAGTGLVLFVVAENNLPQIKKVVSNIIPSQYIPISTTAPSPDTSKMYCPKGMYLDQTDGIYRCHDAHGTRELRSPSGGVPLEAAFYDFDFDQPNMTQPLVQPDINKEIESQIKKHKKTHHKKLAEIPDDHKIHAQIECSDNLKCGTNCYKNGKLYKIVCSQRERDELYPAVVPEQHGEPTTTTTTKHKKKTPPSLTIPPNFPSAVTVTPPSPGVVNPIGETPYPDDTTDQQPVSDQTPTSDIPPLELAPGQQPIKPTLTPTSPTPIAPAPQIGTVFYPFSPAKDNNKKGFASHPYNQDGCRVVDYQHGGSGWTCRFEADNNLMKQNIGENGYKIEATLHIGPPKAQKDKEISITSGGPGSTGGNCCGFTTRINIDTGTLQLEAEGPATTEVVYCKGAQCVDSGTGSIGKNLYNQDIKLTWIVTRQGNDAIYQAIATGPAGTIASKKFSSANVIRARGQPLIPFHYIAVSRIAEDPHRIRVDSADMKAAYFHSPRVTVIPANAYYGSEGYIHGGEDLLI